jgi:hypothetical protein
MCGLNCVQEGSGLIRSVITRVGRRQEWVALIRTQLDVEDGRDVVSVPYAMPVESLCVGAFVGCRSLGTTTIGCVTRVHDGEIWVVPDSTAPKDPGVQRLRRRTAMNGERVWFCGGSVRMELVQGEWRRLNTESPDMTTSRQRSCGRKRGWSGSWVCGGRKHG